MVITMSRVFNTNESRLFKKKDGTGPGDSDSLCFDRLNFRHHALQQVFNSRLQGHG